MRALPPVPCLCPVAEPSSPSCILGHGWSFWSVADHWYKTAPIPTAESSTSFTNWSEGLSYWRMAVDMNRALRVWEASSAVRVHWKGTFQNVRAVNEAT